MAGKLFLCGHCGRKVLCTKLYECCICQKPLCPACRFVDMAGGTYCEECVETHEPHGASIACHVCGCTTFAACPGGCHWVHDADEDPLCSACQEKRK